MKKIFMLQFFMLCFCSFNKTEINDLAKTENVVNLQSDSIVGKWIIPHNAFISITFNKNGTFVFIDYNDKLEKEEVLKGKYQLFGNKLVLNYSDRPKQTFSYYKGIDGDENYYIKKGKYYFVKSE